MWGATQMIADEFECRVEDAIREMDYFSVSQDSVETVRELLVRYRTVKIQANNYKKALEALDHASKQ